MAPPSNRDSEQIEKLGIAVERLFPNEGFNSIKETICERAIRLLEGFVRKTAP